MFNLCNKILAGFICFFYKIIFYKKLKISLPSISFSFFPFRFYSNSKTIIGNKAIISNNCKIIVKGKLQIGSNFFINEYSRIVALDNIIIGNNVTIAQFVSILDHDHAYKYDDVDLIFKGYKTAPIKIGNNVWISDKVTICKGVTIGNNVIIGANSVVTKDILSNSIVAGVPAQVIKNICE
jgi:maltose O-acetyltransferase